MNPRRRRLLPARGALVFLALACAPFAAASMPAAGADRSTVESILARADRADAPSAQMLAQDVIDLGTTALPKMFEALVQETQRPGGHASRRARVVYATCAIAGPARWTPIVEARLVPGAPRATLAAAMALCGECGTSSEMSLLSRAAALDGSGACQAEFERALTAVLVRDSSGFQALDSLLTAADTRVRASIVRAVEGTQALEAAAVLARWAGTRRDVRMLAVPHLSRLALALEPPFAEEVLRPVRMLVEQSENEVLADAIVCAGRLGDYGAVPALTRWLRDGDPGIRANALWSLRRVSGLVLDEDPAAWSAWFAREMEWWEHESHADFALLKTGTRAEKVAVLRTIAGLHAWRDRLAGRVVPVLEDEDHELAMFAGRLLGRLRSRLALPALLEALDHPSETVADAAHAALEAISDRSLPRTSFGCREALGGHL